MVTPANPLRRTWLVALALLVALCTAVTLSAPASAMGIKPPPGDGGGGGGGNNPAPPPPVDDSWRSETVTTPQTTCRLVAGPQYIGATCGVSGSGEESGAAWIEATLDGDPLPTCWDDPLTPQEIRGLGFADLDDGATWVWETCLHGVDPDTFEIHQDGAEISLMYTRKWDHELVTLTSRQRQVVDGLNDTGRVPAPILGASPSPFPLVNQDVSFFNAGDSSLQVNANGAQMRASVAGIRVETGDVTGAVLECAGNGFRARSWQNSDNTPNGCWYAYQSSSLGRDQDAFDSRVIAVWDVEVNTGAGWEHFHTFERASFQRIQVNEVQAINVSERETGG